MILNENIFSFPAELNAERSEVLGSVGALDGQIVVITGATGTAGRAVCQTLMENGASVIATSRSIEALEQLAQELPGDLLDRYVVELTDLASTERMFHDIVDRHHGINAVVHLVGGWRPGGIDRKSVV